MATIVSNRVELQPAYVLHTRLYRETSLLVDCLTQDQGRICVIARGARRPKSPFAGILQPFMPLVISYQGAGELKTLTQAEPHGLFLTLVGDRLASGLYLNELCVRLLSAEYPVPELFDLYSRTLESIAGDQALQPALRLFEKQLLSSLGQDLCLSQDCAQQPVDPQAQYSYDPDQGPFKMVGGQYSGKSLLALASDDLSCPNACAEVKSLLQAMIKKLLGGKPIYSRLLFL